MASAIVGSVKHLWEHGVFACSSPSYGKIKVGWERKVADLELLEYETRHGMHRSSSGFRTLQIDLGLFVTGQESEQRRKIVICVGLVEECKPFF
jgi:hypothetical protein